MCVCVCCVACGDCGSGGGLDSMVRVEFTNSKFRYLSVCHRDLKTHAHGTRHSLACKLRWMQTYISPKTRNNSQMCGKLTLHLFLAVNRVAFRTQTRNSALEFRESKFIRSSRCRIGMQKFLTFPFFPVSRRSYLPDTCLDR